MIFLNAPIRDPKDFEIQDLDPQTYFTKPSLEEILTKCLEMSDNLVLLLPSNTNI